VIPALSYEDCTAAADFLVTAFGFDEVGERFTDEAGRLTHAELEYRGDRVMLGWPGPHYRAPRRHASECAVAHEMYDNPFVVDGVVIHVDDLDAHLTRARDAGAEILRGPEDQPFGRLYTAADPEGHRWMFVQPA
jgi:PhnB protein